VLCIDQGHSTSVSLFAMESLPKPFPRDRWMTIACAVWGLLYALFVARIFATPKHLGVYPIFARGTRRLWDGLPMYVPEEGLDVFRYTPTFALGFSPFGLLPDPLGVALWNLFSLTIFFVSLRVLVHRVFPWSWTIRQEGVFLLLTILAAARGVWSAQSNLLLFSLVFLGVAALLDKRWWRAAFLLALPVHIKIWPIGIAMLLCARWWRPLIARFGAALMALAAAPFLIRPWGEVASQYAGFWNLQLLTGTSRWPGYRDLWTILEQFSTPEWGPYTALRATTAALLFAWCLWQTRRLPSARHFATATLAAWAGWQLLIGPGTERLTYGLIGPFASAAILLSYQKVQKVQKVQEIQNVSTGGLRILSIAAWLMVVVLGSGAGERALLPYLSLAPAIQPAGIVVFLVWVALWDWRYPRP